MNPKEKVILRRVPGYDPGLLQDVFAGGMEELGVAEKTGAGLPTSRMFRRAGYVQLKKNIKFVFILWKEPERQPCPFPNPMDTKPSQKAFPSWITTSSFTKPN
jgi:hypothetical protein